MFVYKRIGLCGRPTLYFEYTNDSITINHKSETIDYVYNSKVLQREIKESYDLITFGDNTRHVKTPEGRDARVVIYIHPRLRPLRTHKKRRVAKKYMKKYGFIVEFENGSYQCIVNIHDTIWFLPNTIADVLNDDIKVKPEIY